MSHASITYLYCDGKDCPLETAACFDGVGPSDTLADQRRRAKLLGWLVAQPGGLDFCPECREARTGHPARRQPRAGGLQ
jgi:hypothetical protein